MLRLAQSTGGSALPRTDDVRVRAVVRTTRAESTPWKDMRALDRIAGLTHDAHEMRSEPWHPTHAQEEAALALADSSVGARVRSHSDGTVEVRTVEKGAFRRYLIEEDGAATLVESRPRTWRYAWSRGFCWLGLLLAFAAPVPVILWKIDDFWAAMMVFAGIFIFVAGLGLMPYGKPPPGERWVLVGGAEE